MLSKEELLKIKERLLEDKNKIEREVKALDVKPEFGDFPGEDDETDEQAAYFNQSSAAQFLRDKLIDLEDALAKIEKQEGYGICEGCGKEIEREILKIIPESKFCQDCKIRENKN